MRNGMVKLGLIGAGGIAGPHVQQLREVREAAIAALVDPDPARLAAIKRRFPELDAVPTYADHRDMLAKEKLDGALVLSPHYVHCQQITDCLRAGLHVLTEKPMVCSVKEARKVMAEEKKAGKILAIGYQRHAQGEFQFVKKAIESGAAGSVQFICAFQGQNWYRGTRGTWRQNRKMSGGGQLNDSGSHLLDIILWVTNLRPRTVTASIENFDSEVDINSALVVEFEGGAQANISVVGNCPIWWEDITIVCSEWSFFLRQGKLTYCTGPRAEVLVLDRTNYPGTNVDRNFVDAILGRAQPLSPSICGLRTIQLTEAAWKSARTGKPARVATVSPERTSAK